jgi:dTDP-4-amino-4,6-dideoxygalactose transaminase
VRELAIFGARPAFDEPLHVGRPNIGDRTRLLERIERMLDDRWLSNNGPLVREFEQRVCDHLGVRNCVATCNGTVALELAIRTTGLTGEVIVPSFTFVATAHALQWQQITPVFCDIDPITLTIDPRRVEELITPRTSGIIGVHLWEQPCAVDELSALASTRGLQLLFDAAQAFGCSASGTMIGNFGRAEVLSFHATKCVNAFEGGAVVTNDDELAARIRLMKNFGFSGYDTVVSVGTNGKMTEIAAAMGLTSLESLGDFVARNRRNHREYARRLEGVPGLSLRSYDTTERRTFNYVVVEVDASDAGLGRDELQRVLWAENVLARRYFYPGCHRMEP